MRWILPSLLAVVSAAAIAAILLLPVSTVEHHRSAIPTLPPMTAPDVAIYTPAPGAPSGCAVFPFSLLEAAVAFWIGEHPGRAHALNGLMGFFAAKVCNDPAFRELLRQWGDCPHGLNDTCANTGVGLSLTWDADRVVQFLVSFDITWEFPDNGTGAQAVWSGNVLTGAVEGPAISYSTLRIGLVSTAA